MNYPAFTLGPRPTHRSQLLLLNCPLRRPLAALEPLLALVPI
jgi:hypothetical protein